MEAMRLASVAAATLVFFSALIFVLVYHRQAPWRSTPYGRHVMALSTVIGLTSAACVLEQVTTGALAASLRVALIVLLVLLAGLLGQRTLMVIRAQREPGDQPPP
jgi:hypothetical protein